MFSQFKWFHAVYAFLGLLIMIMLWVLAQNTAGTFTLSAQVIAGIGTVLTLAKTLQGLLQPSTSNATNIKAAAVKAAGASLLVGSLGLLIFVPRHGHLVVGSALQENGHMAFVEMPAQGCQNGTVTPQTQADIVAAEQLGVCVESTYATDSAKVPAEQPLQIAIDVSLACGADVGDLVSTLGQGTVASPPTAARLAVVAEAQINVEAIHANALAFHAKLGR